MAVIENGVDTSLFRPLPDVAELRRKLGLDGRFVVAYVGTVGWAHGLDTILAAAAALEERLPNVLFILVGEGVDRARLEARARAEGIKNIRFEGQRPRVEIPEYIAACNIGLVLLRRAAAFKMALPTKMLEFMACGRPVLVGVDGVARSIVEKSGAGVFVPPENSDGLVEAIRRFYEDPGLACKMGQHGHQYIQEHFSRRAKASTYLSELEALG
jgi:hypothetical protein